MSVELIVWLVVGAAAGGFINGLAGFGTALMSLGVWLQVMPPWQAVAVVAAMSAASGVQSLWLIRRGLKPGMKRLPRFLIPALVGSPPGTYILTWVSAGELKVLLAVLMIFYSLYFTVKHSLPKDMNPHLVFDGLVGFAGGLLGGAASLSGVLPTTWCAMQPWTKMETSAILRPCNIVVLGIAVIVFAESGYYTAEPLTIAVCALPVTLIASRAGIAVFRRISDTAFRYLLIWMMLASGELLIVRELF